MRGDRIDEDTLGTFLHITSCVIGHMPGENLSRDVRPR